MPTLGPAVRAFVILATLLAVVVAVTVPAGSQTPAPTLLFVDAGSSACSDTRAAVDVTAQAPWCSMTRAIAAAPSGSTTLVRNGDYAGTVSDNRKPDKLTTFKPYPGDAPVAAVTLRGCANIRLEGFRLRGLFVRLCRNPQIVGNDISPGYVKSYANVDPLIEGNYVHDVPGYPANIPDGYGIGLFTYNDGSGSKRNVRPVVRGNRIERTNASSIKTVSSTDALIERNSSDEAIDTTGGGGHVDAVRVDGGVGLTIRNNRLLKAAHGLMFSDNDVVGTVIDNNVVEALYGYGINGTVGPDARITNNTIKSRYGVTLADRPEDSPVLRNVVVVGNATWVKQGRGKGALGPNALEDYNLWPFKDPATRYGANDVFGTPVFNADWSLAAGSPGVGAGFPRRDVGVDVSVLPTR